MLVRLDEFSHLADMVSESIFLHNLKDARSPLRISRRNTTEAVTVVFVFPSYSNRLKLGKVIYPYDINRNQQSTSAFLVQLGSGLTFIQEKVRSHKHYAISLLFLLLLSAYLVNVLVEWSATVQGSLRENCLANTQTTTQPHGLEKGSCNFWKPLSEEEGKQTETCEAKKYTS